MSNASKKISKFTQNKVDQISQELIKSDGTIGCSKGYENSFEKTENFQCLEDPITNFMFKPTLGSSIAGDLKSYAERGVWTPDFGESIKKTESFKGMNKAQQQKILQSLKNDAPTKSEGDPLKDLLQNEENPIKQAAA